LHQGFLLLHLLQVLLGLRFVLGFLYVLDFVLCFLLLKYNIVFALAVERPHDTDDELELFSCLFAFLKYQFIHVPVKEPFVDGVFPKIDNFLVFFGRDYFQRLLYFVNSDIILFTEKVLIFPQVIIPIIPVRFVLERLIKSLRYNAILKDLVPVDTVFRQELQTVDLCDHDIVPAGGVDEGQDVKVVCFGFVCFCGWGVDKCGKAQL
jgi:hypothetical protein